MELLHKRDEKIKIYILYIYIIHYICIYRCLRLSEAADTKAKEPQLLLADPDNTAHVTARNDEALPTVPLGGLVTVS